MKNLKSELLSNYDNLTALLVAFNNIVESPSFKNNKKERQETFMECIPVIEKLSSLLLALCKDYNVDMYQSFATQFEELKKQVADMAQEMQTLKTKVQYNSTMVRTNTEKIERYINGH